MKLEVHPHWNLLNTHTRQNKRAKDKVFLGEMRKRGTAYRQGSEWEVEERRTKGERLRSSSRLEGEESGHTAPNRVFI